MPYLSTYAMILLISVTPFICGGVSLLAGKEEAIDAYFHFKKNEIFFLNGTLISSKESVEKSEIITETLYSYDYQYKWCEEVVVFAKAETTLTWNP